MIGRQASLALTPSMRLLILRKRNASSYGSLHILKACVVFIGHPTSTALPVNQIELDAAPAKRIVHTKQAPAAHG